MGDETVGKTSLDPRARRFLDLLAAGVRADVGAPDLRDLRRANAELAGFAVPAPAVERHAVTLKNGGPALRVYSPEGAGRGALPGVVYFHGGGWLSGDLDTHDAVCAVLSARAGIRLIAVDYRLAPEHRFPAALEDGLAALRAVRADPKRFGVAPDRLAIGGDSAGANVAVVVARMFRDEAPQLALQLLLCPVMEPLGRTPSRAALGRGHLIEEATMAIYWENYRVAGLSPDDPRVAPLRADEFAGMPPALIHAAEFDPLRDEAVLYAEALRRDGVAAKLTVHAGLIHHFYGLGGVIPAARRALEAVADDLRDALTRND